MTPYGPLQFPPNGQPGWTEQPAPRAMKFTALAKIKLPKSFTGDQEAGPTLKNYVMQLETVKGRWEKDGFDMIEFFKSLATTLDGEAETYYRLVRGKLLEEEARGGAGTGDPTERFLKLLRQQFPVLTPARIAEFEHCRRREKESLMAFYHWLVELAEDLGMESQWQLVAKFLDGLEPSLAAVVRPQTYALGVGATLEETYQLARTQETAQRFFEADSRATEKKKVTWGAAMYARGEEAVEPVLYAEEGRVKSERGRDDRKCFQCGEVGHHKRDCKKVLLERVSEEIKS